jgi:hypothetical protein
MDVEIIQANPRLGVMALINGDVSFTGTFVSTVRGILSGFPMKIVLVMFKKGVYYLIAHPSVKDIQDLKGKKLGVSSIRGADHWAEELLKSAVSTGRSNLLKATPRCACSRCSYARRRRRDPPHDLMKCKVRRQFSLGCRRRHAGAGMITSDRLIKENPQFNRRGVRATSARTA